MKEYWRKMSLNDLFGIVLSEEKEKSRQAARDVRKRIFSGGDRKSERGDLDRLIREAPKKYVDIAENWRRENFVMAISVIYFLHDREDDPDFLFPWLLYLLEEKNGNIRQAAVRMIGNELGLLTVHIRFPNEKRDYSDLKPANADLVLLRLFVSLHKIMQLHWKDSYERHKYIHTLPPSPYKSAQLLLRDMERLCGEEYMEELDNKVIQAGEEMD
ncbi:MAG: hypothetical protein R6V40_01900 [Candidatus Moraniibacteriota bacterium]